MSIDSLKAEKEVVENNILKEQETLESNCEKIKALSKIYIKKHLQQIVENEVKINPDHTKSLDIAQLKEMKQKLNVLLEDSDYIVEGLFLDSNAFVHKNYVNKYSDDLKSNGFDNAKRAKDNIEKAIKLALGYAGKLLADYGYVEIKESFRGSITGKWGVISAKTAYMYRPQLDSELHDSIEKYYMGIFDLHSSLVELQHITKKISEQEAIDIWDNL